MFLYIHQVERKIILQKIWKVKFLKYVVQQRSVCHGDVYGHSVERI